MNSLVVGEKSMALDEIVSIARVFVHFHRAMQKNIIRTESFLKVDGFRKHEIRQQLTI